MSGGRDYLPGGSIADVAALKDRFDRQSRANRAAQEANAVFDNGRELWIRSPNGHYWSISVSDAGVVSAVDKGTTLP